MKCLLTVLIIKFYLQQQHIKSLSLPTHTQLCACISHTSFGKDYYIVKCTFVLMIYVTSTSVTSSYSFWSIPISLIKYATTSLRFSLTAYCNGVLPNYRNDNEYNIMIIMMIGFEKSWLIHNSYK